MFFLITFLDILLVLMSHSFTITCYGLISFLMIFFDIQFSSVQFSHSVMSDSAHQASLSITNSQSLHKFMSMNSSPCWDGDAIQLSHPLSSPSLPAFSISQHQGLSQWVSSSHQVAKYWSFSFSISPSNEYSGLISFRMDWLDLLAVQGTLKSLQHHSSNASVL